VGFLHKERAGRPSLAIDFMEPFRPLIADQAVLTGLNHGQFRAEHFAEERGGIQLTDGGKRVLLGLIEQRLAGSLTLPGGSTAVSWREAIGISAQALAKALRSKAVFEPLVRP
jgi:CRISPR-associated protein Cas1